MKDLEKKARFVEQSLQGFAMDLCSNLDGMYYEGTKMTSASCLCLTMAERQAPE